MPPAAILVFAGVSKLLDPAAFQLALFEYRLIGFGLSGLVAGYLPAFELVTGIALALRVFPTGAALAACGLFATFIAALAHSLLTGASAECGCFGILSLPTPVALALDAALLSCTAATLRLEIVRASGDDRAAVGGC